MDGPLERPGPEPRRDGALARRDGEVHLLRAAHPGSRASRRAAGGPATVGDVQTACQQSCPAQAIVFGDGNDPQGAIAALRQRPRAFQVLAELGVEPGVTYLARVRAARRRGAGRARRSTHERQRPPPGRPRETPGRGRRRATARSRARSPRPLERPRRARAWWAAFLVAASCAGARGRRSSATRSRTGIGIWGLNRTVGWGFDITNFVFWVGIGHAGTLISAILLLFRQQWRTSINRAAEAMTIFAVMCAGIFPLIHMGRPWLAFWMFPYPNTRGSLWVNFRSPLVWDVFAISTYFTVSLLFWYVGMIPDFATLRDRAPGPAPEALRLAEPGWNGSARTWQRYEKACLLLAGLATPLVVSVHTIVSLRLRDQRHPRLAHDDLPALLRGRRGLHRLRHGDDAAAHHAAGDAPRAPTSRCATSTTWPRCCSPPGCIVGFAYATEIFIAWYSGNRYERFTFRNRAFGPYAWAYWLMVTCNVVVPQMFWFARARRSRAAAVRGRAPGERGDVVRALHHHRDLAAPRLPAVVLEHLRADARRARDPARAASASSSPASCCSCAWRRSWPSTR